jgi:hypothetical protein
MSAGDALDVVAVDHRALGPVDLGLMLGADIADEFDGHGMAPVLGREEFRR